MTLKQLFSEIDMGAMLWSDYCKEKGIDPSSDDEQTKIAFANYSKQQHLFWTLCNSLGPDNLIQLLDLVRNIKD